MKTGGRIWEEEKRTFPDTNRDTEMPQVRPCRSWIKICRSPESQIREMAGVVGPGFRRNPAHTKPDLEQYCSNLSKRVLQRCFQVGRQAGRDTLAGTGLSANRARGRSEESASPYGLPRPNWQGRPPDPSEGRAVSRRGRLLQPTITVPIEFYRGVKAIAKFLEMHERTVKRLLEERRIPAKKDETGRWVLTNLDYYQSLQG